jgi:hypothetical protein
MVLAHHFDGIRGQKALAIQLAIVQQHAGETQIICRRGQQSAAAAFEFCIGKIICQNAFMR